MDKKYNKISISNLKVIQSPNRVLKSTMNIIRVIKSVKLKQSKQLGENIIKDIACPYCKNTNVKKHGKAGGQQRYMCKNNDCKRTFLENHYSTFRFSKKFHHMWQDFYKLMVEGYTIRQCAAKLKISQVTAFMWRHKILDSFKAHNEVEVLKEYVELTKLICKENFKGSRNVPKGERSRINIVSAIDNSKNIISVPLTKNSFRIKHLNKRIFPKIDKNAYTVGYQDSRFNVTAAKHNKLNKNKNKKNEEIDRFFSIKAAIWIRKFHGIATKFIDHYLEWYIYLYKNDNSSNINDFNLTSNIKWCQIRGKTITFEV